MLHQLNELLVRGVITCWMAVVCAANGVIIFSFGEVPCYPCHKCSNIYPHVAVRMDLVPDAALAIVAVVVVVHAGQLVLCRFEIFRLRLCFLGRSIEMVRHVASPLVIMIDGLLGRLLVPSFLLGIDDDTSCWHLLVEVMTMMARSVAPGVVSVFAAAAVVVGFLGTSCGVVVVHAVVDD